MGFKVARIYRKHPMSMVDGGVSVVVERTDGRVREYPDVKKPDAFIAAIWRQAVDGELSRVYVKETDAPVV